MAGSSGLGLPTLPEQLVVEWEPEHQILFIFSFPHVGWSWQVLSKTRCGCAVFLRCLLGLAMRSGLSLATSSFCPAAPWMLPHPGL